jgi:hypothetical protein
MCCAVHVSDQALCCYCDLITRILLAVNNVLLYNCILQILLKAILCFEHVQNKHILMDYLTVMYYCTIMLTTNTNYSDTNC